MAAAKSTFAKKRNLSLDLVAATKENEERLKVWATLSSNERNGTTNISDIDNKSEQSEQQGSHLYTRKKKGRKDAHTIEIGNTPPNLQAQSSEYKKKWFQKFVSWRYCMVLLLQSAFVVGMFMRNCLPMAMVCMVKPRSAHSRVLSNGTGSKSGTDGISSQPVIESVSFSPNDTHSEVTHYEFDWSAEVQGLVLTSIMFSTFLGPLMVVVVKDRLGLKFTMTLMNLSGFLLTILSPEAARISPYCLVVIRLLLGLTMGGTVTVVGDCIAWWAPQDEKLTMISLSFTGVNIGTIFASLLSGYLCLMPWDNGWPFVFYTFGAISLVWGTCWHFLSSIKPEDHPYISEREKQYILSYRSGMDAPPSGKKVKPPYRKVMTSVPVLAYFAASSCHVWSSQVLFTYLPTFFNKQMKFAVQETGLLTSLISLFRMLGTFWWTILGNKTVPAIGVNKSRKMCICAGFFLTGACTITVGFFDDNYRWVVTGLLIFLMINQSVGTSTIQALPLDMAPRYAGLVTGINMSLANFFSISGPLLTAAVTSNGTLQEWHTVWIIMGCMFITGSTIFLIFGHATPQPWADGKDEFNIFSPFITMGRRFSTFMEAPPLSPGSPTNKRFVFPIQLQTNPENILSHIGATSPEILYTGHFEFGRIEANKDTLKSNVNGELNGELNESTISIDDDSDTNNGRSDDEAVIEQPKPIRKRAFSEFGLEVLRSKDAIDDNVEDLDTETLGNNIVGVDRDSVENNGVDLDTGSLGNNGMELDTESVKNTNEGFDTGQSSMTNQITTREENEAGFVREHSDHIQTAGIENKAFEDTEHKNAADLEEGEVPHN